MKILNIVTETFFMVTGEHYDAYHLSRAVM